MKTSLAPGSKVVTEYLEVAGLQDDLDKLGFNLVGYGCTTCIGNSGPLPSDIESQLRAIEGGFPAVGFGEHCLVERDCPFHDRCWPEMLRVHQREGGNWFSWLFFKSPAHWFQC